MSRKTHPRVVSARIRGIVAALSILFSGFIPCKSQASPNDAVAMSTEDDCALLEVVLAEHLKITGRSNLPLRTDIEGVLPTTEAGANNSDPASRIYPQLFSRLPATQQADLQHRLRAGSPHPYRISCHWRRISFPERPAPDHRWCGMLGVAYISAAEADAKLACPFPGGISVSRPVRTTDGGWAIVQGGVMLMPLDGEGFACLLHKVQNVWTIVHCAPTWVS